MNLNSVQRHTKFLMVAGSLLLMACQTLEASDSKTGQFGAKAPPFIDKATKNTIGEFRHAISDLAEKVTPQVVSIQTISEAQVQPEFFNPFEEFFFGPGSRQRVQPQERPRQQGLGSGVIVSAEGHILTNNHVVEKAENITVTLADKREFKAKIVGTDPQTDVAVIKLETAPKDLPIAFFGRSDSLRIGEWVVAIGNPYGLSHTVTTGIVSAKGVHGRGITSYENFIQTDAAINPGNSGGALFNLDGELVGINTAILSRTGGFQGIGFAIPIDLARNILEDLVSDGKVSRGWLGVSIQDVDPNLAKAMKIDSVRGAVINEVFAGSPAEKAKLKAGDVVVEVDGKPIADANGLRHSVAMVRPGGKTKLTVLREGKKMQIIVAVASRDNAPEIASIDGNSQTGPNQLGIQVTELSDEQRKAAKLGPDEKGVMVQAIEPRSVADMAGLRQGDIILKIDRNDVTGIASFQNLVKKSSDSMLLLVKRAEGRLFIALNKN